MGIHPKHNREETRIGNLQEDKKTKETLKEYPSGKEGTQSQKVRIPVSIGRSFIIIEQRELECQPELYPWFKKGDQPKLYIDRDPNFWNSVLEKGNKAVNYTFDIYS